MILIHSTVVIQSSKKCSCPLRLMPLLKGVSVHWYLMPRTTELAGLTFIKPSTYICTKKKKPAQEEMYAAYRVCRCTGMTI